jgi:hypothetical protein
MTETDVARFKTMTDKELLETYTLTQMNHGQMIDNVINKYGAGVYRSEYIESLEQELRVRKLDREMYLRKEAVRKNRLRTWVLLVTLVAAGFAIAFVLAFIFLPK